MTDRIHRALDGELSRDALNADERAQLDALTGTTEEAVRALRSTPAPDLSAAVMARLEAAPQPLAASSPVDALGRALAWLWRPRDLSLTLRPAYAFAAMAVAVLAVGVSDGSENAPAPVAPIVAAEFDAPRLYVQFRIDAADASSVALAGSFTEWEPRYTLTQTTPGVWTVMVPLEPGVHDYTFVIDGERWVVDPYAPQVDDSFGGSNSRLFLTTPQESA